MVEIMDEETKSRDAGSNNGSAPLETRSTGAAAAPQGGLSLAGASDTPNPAPSTTSEAAPKPPQPVAPPAKSGSLAEEVGLVLPDAAQKAPAPTATPQPAKPPAPAPAAPAALRPAQPAPAPAEPLQHDIADILKEVKLPERRAEEEKPARVYDTSLVSQVESPSTPSGEAPKVPATPAAPAAPEKATKPLAKVSAMPHAAPAPVSAPSPEPAQRATPAPAEGPAPDAIASMHTFKEDLQHVVRDRKVSLVRAAALEQEKRRPDPIDEEVPKTRRGMGVLFASAMLIVLGAGAFGGVYYVVGRQAGTPAPAASESLVFAERSVMLPLDGRSELDLQGDLANVRAGAGGTLGAITRVIPAFIPTDADGQNGPPRPSTFSEFLSAIGASPPDDLLRSLDQEFFLGIHTVDENAPLIVVPVSAYDRAFAGMLAWERSMNDDLAPLFAAVPALRLGDSGIPEVRTFQDEVMRNYDVRTLTDDSGTIQLYYSFPTRNLLIIAESPYSFTEILSRLQAERRL
jgi:hypothetical protein